jgi:hypothetical protein
MNNKMYVILIIALILGFILSTTTGSLVEGDKSKTSPNPSPNIICYSELQKLCDEERQISPDKCHTCSGKHASEFEKVGCTNDDFDTWCKQKPIQLTPTGIDHETFYNKIKGVFEESNSDGVLISMLYILGGINTMLDGSGTIIHKGNAEWIYISDIFSGCYGSDNSGDCCQFGFIWDTPYTNLVDFLFSRDAYTTPIKKDCVSDDKNYCTLVNINLKEPNRSSTGLEYMYNTIRDSREFPDRRQVATALQCKNERKFTIDNTLNYEPETFSGSCFKELIENKKSLYKYNEAVILNTVGGDGIEINEGLKLLHRLDKPKPVALIFLSNDSWGLNKCRDEKVNNNYNLVLKTLNLNFTGDTLVINLLKNPSFDTSTLTFNGYTTLGEM